jgi:hypothetical protein
MIVQTMGINMIMPYITLATTIMIPKIMRKLFDNSDPYKTKKNSIAQFKNQWMGGEYLIHYK